MTRFPGADTDRERARYAVVGAPLDATTSFRPGARFGPERVRRFARTLEDDDVGVGDGFSQMAVHDAGDVRAWPDPAEYVEHLAAELRALIHDDVVPVVVGGEHTVTVAGVRAPEPETLVVLDAHVDLRESYEGEEMSHACVGRRALETVDRLVVLGARSGSEAEWDRVREADVTAIAPGGVEGWLDDTDLGALGPTYLSVDVDAADPSVAPGTGTPAPFGLSARTMRAAVRGVAPHAVGFDVVEVTDDDDGQAAVLAAGLLRQFVFRHAVPR